MYFSPSTASFSCCRDPGNEGLDPELFGEEGGGIRPGEERPAQWPQEPCLYPYRQHCILWVKQLSLWTISSVFLQDGWSVCVRDAKRTLRCLTLCRRALLSVEHCQHILSVILLQRVKSVHVAGGWGLSEPKPCLKSRQSSSLQIHCYLFSSHSKSVSRACFRPSEGVLWCTYAKKKVCSFKIAEALQHIRILNHGVMRCISS